MRSRDGRYRELGRKARGVAGREVCEDGTESVGSRDGKRGELEREAWRVGAESESGRDVWGVGGAKRGES